MKEQLTKQNIDIVIESNWGCEIELGTPEWTIILAFVWMKRAVPPSAATVTYSLKWSNIVCLNIYRSHSALPSQMIHLQKENINKNEWGKKPEITAYTKIYNFIYKYDWTYREHWHLRKSNNTKSQTWIIKILEK